MIRLYTYGLFFATALISISASAQEGQYLVFPNDYNYSNDTRFEVDGKKIKKSNGTPRTLNKSHNFKLREHIHRLNLDPYPEEIDMDPLKDMILEDDRTRNRDEFPPQRRGIPQSINLKLIIKDPEREREFAEIRHQSREIIKKIIIPFLKDKSIGDITKLRNKYANQRRIAEESLTDTSHTQSISSSDPASFLRALTENLNNFEKAQSAYNVCEPLLDAWVADVSVAKGIERIGPLISPEDHFPGSEEVDYAKSLQAQIPITEAMDFPLFHFSDSELSEIKAQIDRYTEFGEAARATAASWALGLGAFDAEIIKIVADFSVSDEDAHAFFDELEVLARKINLSRLGEATGQLSDDPDLVEILANTYDERLRSITDLNLIYEAQIAAELNKSEELAHLLNAFADREPARTDTQPRLFETGVNQLRRNKNLDLFKALLRIAETDDEKQSLFQILKEQDRSIQNQLYSILGDILIEDMGVLLAEREAVLSQGPRYESMNPLDLQFASLNSTNSSDRSKTLLSQIRRRILQQSQYAMSNEDADRMESLERRTQRYKRTLVHEISWANEQILESNIDPQQKAQLAGKMARLHLFLTGEWKESLHLLGGLVEEPSSEALVAAGLSEMQAFLPLAVDFAYQDEMNRIGLLSDFDRFILQHYNAFIEAEFANPQTNNARDLISLKREIYSRLNASQIEQLHVDFENEMHQIFQRWEQNALDYPQFLADSLPSLTEENQ